MQINVDDELAYIIDQMNKDLTTNKAIRNYAKAYIGVKPQDVEEWKKHYEKKY